MPMIFNCVNEWCGNKTDRPFTPCWKCEKEKQKNDEKEKRRREFERKHTKKEVEE